ncbi:Histone acetyltransferase HAC1-like protein [Drosera capensis]
MQLKKILRLLAHASQCCLPTCQHSKCRAIKALFCHGKQCKVRVAGGCARCKRMWQFIQLHSRVCKDPDCKVPRCRDLREYLRRIQQQSDSRRRAAVMEMMRLRSREAT